jgi:hypothetical protein
MGDVSWKGGSQEVARPTTIAWVKMEEACNLYNVIEIFYRKKVTKTERGGPFSPFKLQMALTQLCKNIFACLCRHPNTSTTKGNWLTGC